MAKKLPHTSEHQVGEKTVKVARLFDQVHLDAGYHELTFGEHSTPDHELHGNYDNGIVVEHVEGEPVYGPREEDGAHVLLSGAVTHGPEFKVTWPFGASVAVLCADVVRGYLEGAQKS